MGGLARYSRATLKFTLLDRGYAKEERNKTDNKNNHVKRNMYIPSGKVDVYMHWANSLLACNQEFSCTKN